MSLLACLTTLARCSKVLPLILDAKIVALAASLGRKTLLPSCADVYIDAHFLFSSL